MMTKIKERIKELERMIKEWDRLAKENPNNINNLSTSERQDWVDEINDLKYNS